MSLGGPETLQMSPLKRRNLRKCKGFHEASFGPEILMFTWGRVARRMTNGCLGMKRGGYII